MKTKTVSLVAIGMILVAAIAVSYLISRPALFVSQKSMPVFMGEEVVIHKAATAVKARTVVKAAKAVSAPMPQPKLAVPLPILPPRISYRVLPNYPATALEQGLGGTAILSIYVGLNGDPKQVVVKSSSGVAELDKSAVTAVSQWKFNPAAQGGKAIASRFELPVRFEIK
ncbi:MAG: energy transducer TonB [Candidatus Margulisiibacteriota bacterium]